jgi:arylsulfatase A-like enzyme
VFILADDLGYGDVQCLTSGGKIPTPHLNLLAQGGMTFTDAHSSSAVCTPTRYGLMTGRYNWRSRLKSGVLGGMSPPLIEPGRWTVASFLRQQGYHTAAIGKWHLGLDWPRQPGAEPGADTIEKGPEAWRVNYSKPITRGPNEAGFDYFYGIAASLDMVPYAFIENDRVTSVPTIDNAFPMMAGRTNRATRRGPAAADFEAIDVLPALTRRAVDYLEQRASEARAGRPFFLYLPLNAPHTPIVPAREWQGRSGINPYADFVMQTDASVGAVLAALDRLDLSQETLVIFASDNGCSPEAKFDELLERGHRPSAGFRGAKADIFEGGHRVPFIARWPGRVGPGTSSDQLICLNDFFATCADILGKKLPDNAAEDSVSFLPALEGRATKPLREALVHHSIDGSFAIRQGRWKLSLTPSSGGWSAPRPGSPAAKALPPIQLHDLVLDPGETNNLQAAHPEVTGRLTKLLEKYVSEGRSTPGIPQTNTTPVELPQALTPRSASGAEKDGSGGRAEPVASVSRSSAHPASHARVDEARKPNLVVVLADQWRAQAFGFAGDPNVKTPHFDGLAAGSVRLINAVSGMPVCTPMRASFFTGQRPLTHGLFLNDVSLATNAVTLAKVLRDAGYDTGIIGKWHIDGRGRSSFIPPERRQGFDYWRVQECTHNYTNSTYFADGPERLTWPGYDAIAQTREAGAYLRARSNSGRPFALILAWGPPHDPYLTAPEKYRALYDPAKLVLRPNVPAAFEETIRRNLAGYYAHCTALDDCMGDLLRTLEGTGLAENTILMFTADHGDMLGSQGLAKKQKPFDESIRVPLLVRWPRGLGGVSRSFDAPINSEDLMPTLLGLCGVTIPKTVEGLDYSHYLRGGTNPGDGATVIQCIAPFGEWERRTGGKEYRGVRTERHTYVRDLQGPWLLFDNEADPYQTNNLVNLPDHSALQLELEAILSRKLKERGDEFLPAEDYIRKWGYRVNANGTVPYKN